MILPDFPLRVEFEISGVCNLKCTCCYAKPFSNYFPPAESLQYLFEKTEKEAQPFEVILLGGEPFARKDIINVVELALKTFKHGVGISTNGTLLERLSETDVTRLRESAANGLSVQVSIDSIDPAINNITRGKTKNVINGLNLLEKYEIPFSVGIVLTTANEADVVKTSEYLSARYAQLRVLNLEPLQPSLGLGDVYFQLRVDPQKMVNIYKSVSRLVSVSRNDVKVVGVVEDCQTIKEGVQPLIETYDFKSCMAGLLRAGVLTNGDVTPCVTIRDLSLGNLYVDSWRDIWKRSKERFLSLNHEGRQCQLNNLVRKEVVRERVKT